MKIGVELRKWGNSIGLRIPVQIMDNLNLVENTKVNLTVEGNRLIIEKDNPLPSLDEIIDSIPENFDYPEDIADFVAGASLGDELI